MDSYCLFYDSFGKFCMAEVPTSRPAMANGVSVPSENQSPGYSAKMQVR